MRNDLSKNTGTYLIDEAAPLSFAKQQRFERETSNVKRENRESSWMPNNLFLLFLFTIDHSP